MDECDYCGVPWLRSKLRRDRSGLLYCPDEGGGLDQVTLNEQNAANAARRTMRAFAGGDGVRGVDNYLSLSYGSLSKGIEVNDTMTATIDAGSNRIALLAVMVESFTNRDLHAVSGTIDGVAGKLIANVRARNPDLSDSFRTQGMFVWWFDEAKLPSAGEYTAAWTHDVGAGDSHMYVLQYSGASQDEPDVASDEVSLPWLVTEDMDLLTPLSGVLSSGEVLSFASFSSGATVATIAGDAEHVEVENNGGAWVRSAIGRVASPSDSELGVGWSQSSEFLGCMASLKIEPKQDIAETRTSL